MRSALLVAATAALAQRTFVDDREGLRPFVRIVAPEPDSVIYGAADAHEAEVQERNMRVVELVLHFYDVVEEALQTMQLCFRVDRGNVQRIGPPVPRGAVTTRHGAFKMHRTVVEARSRRRRGARR